MQTESGFHSFTSMNGSKLEEKQSDRDREIVVQNAGYRLEIITRTSEDAFVLCKAPKNGRMMPLVRESLTAGVHVKLTDKSTGQVVFEDDGCNAGIEYGGESLKSQGL